MDEKEQKFEESYEVKIYCCNCSYGGLMGVLRLIPKGIKVMDFLINENCPACGCHTLRERFR